MFTVSEYLALYNGTFGKTLKEQDLQGVDRIVKRIERVQGKFDHGRVAAHFLQNQGVYLPALGVDTIDRFDKLIAALTKALPE
ncbi:MAG: hypothetical protein JNK87_39065, partial [Bryobacterales bacterium]|nr:hypothetical protein [Bryobacterales bacterium]